MPVSPLVLKVMYKNNFPTPNPTRLSRNTVLVTEPQVRALGRQARIPLLQLRHSDAEFALDQDAVVVGLDGVPALAVRSGIGVLVRRACVCGSGGGGGSGGG